MSTKSRALSASMLLSLCAGIAVADEDIGMAAAEEDLFALEDDLVTTASRAAEPVRLAPASVTTVSRAEIDAMAYATVAEALLGVRGLYQTDDRFYVSLGVRGFNRFGDYGNRLQVQLDGHVMNDDWIFSSYIGNDLATDIEHVDSIEVVRGPGSALYGTGAFFGVVNLTTPKVLDHTLRVSTTLLDFDSARVHVDGGHHFDDGVLRGATFWVSAGGSTRPGRDLQQDAYIGTPWALDGNAEGADAYSTGTVIAKGTLGDFTLEGSFHQRNRRVPTGTFGVVYGDLRNMGSDARGFLELRYEPLLLDGVQLLSRVYVDGQGYEGHYTYTDPTFSPSGETFDALWTGLETRVQLDVIDGLRGTVGVEGQVHPYNHWFGKDEPATEPYLDQSSTFAYLSAYALADWAPWPQLHLHAGARFDGWLINVPEGNDPEPAAFLPSVNPRLAAIWLPTDDDTLKLMLGRAYRIPSIYELSDQENGFSFQDNQEIGSETIYTGELEYRRRLPFDTSALFTVYVNRVSDLLTYVVEDSTTVEGVVNVPEPLWTTGVETELRHQTASGLVLSGQYSFQRTRLNDPFGEELVANSPEHTGAVLAMVPLMPTGDLKWSARAVFDLGRIDRDGAVTDPFVVVDTTLSGRLPHVRWAVGVRNALDTQYEHPVSDRLLAPRLLQDGRTLRLDLAVDL